jgi:hypothetical protein
MYEALLDLKYTEDSFLMFKEKFQTLRLYECDSHNFYIRITFLEKMKQTSEKIRLRNALYSYFVSSSKEKKLKNFAKRHQMENCF